MRNRHLLGFFYVANFFSLHNLVYVFKHKTSHDNTHCKRKIAPMKSNVEVHGSYFVNWRAVSYEYSAEWRMPNMLFLIHLSFSLCKHVFSMSVQVSMNVSIYLFNCSFSHSIPYLLNRANEWFVVFFLFKYPWVIFWVW